MCLVKAKKVLLGQTAFAHSYNSVGTLIDVHVTGGSFPSSNARTRNFVVAGAGVGASTMAMAGCNGAIINIILTMGSFPSDIARTRNLQVASSSISASTVAIAGCSGAIINVVITLCTVPPMCTITAELTMGNGGVSGGMMTRPVHARIGGTFVHVSRTSCARPTHGTFTRKSTDMIGTSTTVLTWWCGR